MSVRAVLERLRGEGQKVASGRFQVDGAKALAKLREFRLARPSDYLLELVRAAVASGATQVDLDLKLADMELRFDAAFPADTLRNLFGAALSSRRDEATVRARLLAFGVLGALALKPKHVEVESGGVLVRVRPPDQVEVTDSAAPAGGTRVALRRAGGWRAVRWLSQPDRELAAVHGGTGFFPARLVINGEEWTAESWPPENGFAHRDHAADGRHFRVFVAPTADTVAQLRVAVHGVMVCTERVDVGALPLVGWVRDDRLRRDASGAQIVRDDKAYLAVLEAAETLADDLLEELVGALEGPQGPGVKALLRSCAVKVAEDEYKASKRARALLDGAPLLEGPAGEPVRLADVQALVAAGKPVRICVQPWPAGLYDPPVVLLGQVPALEATLPKARENVEPQIHARRLRDRNRARFETLPREAARIPDTDPLARAPVTGPGLSGEVIVPAGAATTFVRFLKGGRLLQHKEVPSLLPLRVTAVVDSDAFEADETWQGVRPDATHDGAVQAVRAAALDAVAAAVAAGEPSADLRAHARDAVAAFLASGDPMPDALRTTPIYEQAGGGTLSVEALDDADSLRFVTSPQTHGALDGRPVVHMDGREAELWKKRKGPRKVRDFGDQAQREREIRARMAGPKEPPRLSGSPVQTPVLGDGITGELGLRDFGDGGLDVRFLKDGFFLETRRLATSYGRLAAVVEAPGFPATPSWDGVVEGPVLQAALAAVRAAEPRLILPLVKRFGRVPWHELPVPVAAYAQTFVRRHLAPASRRARIEPIPVDEELRQAALDGLRFQTSRGRLALRALVEAVRKQEHLFVVSPDHDGELPDAILVVVADEDAAGLMAALTDREPETPWAEINRIRTREEFERLPVRAASLPAGFARKVPIDEQGFRGELGHAAGAAPGVEVEVLHRGRLLTGARIDGALPLRAVVEASPDGVDPADFGLPPDLDKALRAVIASAAARLVEATLAEVEDPWSRDLLLHAIAGGHHERLPELRTRALYPTTDGRALSFADLAERKTVAFAAQPLEGALASGEPVIRAVDAGVKAALGALGKKRRDVTAALAAQIEARRAREKVRPVEAVRVAGRPLRRRAFQVDNVDGEVAFTSGTGGTLAVFHERRLLAQEPLAVPAGVEAAVNNDQLKPLARQENVRRDATFKKTVALVLDQVDALARETAEGWDAATKGERAKLGPILVRVAAWLVGRGVRNHRLFGLPLLTATDGRALTFADLLRSQHERGHVPVADREGRLLDETLWAWRPRPGELLGLPRPLRPEDATAALVWADRVRAAPSVSPTVDLPSRWREPVMGQDLEGEVVVAQGPLVLELVRDGRLLETATFDHPMGGRARVDCGRLVPDPLRARVMRDEAFQAVRSAAEAALERAVARLLREGGPRDWEDLVDKAIAWRFGAEGPVAEALNGLAVFRDHTDAPVTIGRVVAEASSRGSVAVLEPGQSLDAPPPLVLWAGGTDRRRLSLLRVKLADQGDAARRDAKRRDRREERRLPSLRYGDRAVLRLSVDEDGWRGELALPQPPDRAGAIVLARDGIAVDQFHVGDVGVAGVLDHAELPVTAGWENAVLDDAWRERLRRLADGLFARLAEEGPRMDAAERETASFYVLRRLASAGVVGPRHLDRLEGLEDALARAAVFVTITGERLDLRAVASRVVREPPVTVLPFEAGDGARRFALRALPAVGPWVAALGAVLGPGSIVVVGSAAEWRRREAEREPEPDDPVARGVAELRRELARLSGAAVGRLDKDVLQDVRVHRGGGKAPAVWYDAARGVGLVDPEHPGVGRALRAAGTDEDALYVVLASLVGAANRALEAVTDEDERTLIGTLLDRVDGGPAR